MTTPPQEPAVAPHTIEPVAPDTIEPDLVPSLDPNRPPDPGLPEAPFVDAAGTCLGIRSAVKKNLLQSLERRRRSVLSMEQ